MTAASDIEKKIAQCVEHRETADKTIKRIDKELKRLLKDLEAIQNKCQHAYKEETYDARRDIFRCTKCNHSYVA